MAGQAAGDGDRVAGLDSEVLLRGIGCALDHVCGDMFSFGDFVDMFGGICSGCDHIGGHMFIVWEFVNIYRLTGSWCEHVSGYMFTKSLNMNI